MDVSYDTMIDFAAGTVSPARQNAAIPSDLPGEA
jgi:hypothetical protein